MDLCEPDVRPAADGPDQVTASAGSDGYSARPPTSSAQGPAPAFHPHHRGEELDRGDPTQAAAAPIVGARLAIRRIGRCPVAAARPGCLVPVTVANASAIHR